MKSFLSWVLFTLLFISNLAAQERNCGTMDVLDRQVKENPFILKNMEEIERQTQEYLRQHPNGPGNRVVVTIPVVVHVVWNSAVPAQNISDAQIQSQIDVLNMDYSAGNIELNSTNFDTPTYPLGLFNGVVANAEVQFCLAQQDPNGNPTNGITRKSSTVASWGTNDNVKKTAMGGVDPWNAANYLNIWVCNIGGGILGYAQFPGGPAATDGVVCDYRYFGNTGTATAPYHKGRTATHEVGHWLNLRHIWGDATCGSDLVSDTPVHNTSNGGCPVYPHLSTCTGTPIEMTMNYMDYTYDACMYMFSNGQKARLQAVLNSGGARAGLMSSPGCLPPNPNQCNAPAGLATSNITTNSATSSWTAASGAVSYTFEYKLNSAATWTVQNVTGTSFDLTGLSSGATYNTRVMTNCSAGSSAYSPVVDFTTTSTAVCNAPTGLATSAITQTTATSTWAAVSGAVSYVYEIKANSATTWTTTTVTGTTVNVTGLTASTLYNTRVKTNCSNGSSGYSSTVNFTTTAACNDSYESNNTASAAKNVSVGTALSAKIGTATDVDWFKFNNSNSKKNIKVNLSNLPADYDIVLYRGTSTQVGISENDGTLPEQIIYNNTLSSTTHYVKIYGFNGAFNNNSCYSLLVQTSGTVFRLDTDVIDLEAQPVADEFLVFPNPANDQVTLVVPFGKHAEGVVTVYDITGKVMSVQKVNGDRNLKTFNMDVSGFNAGLYMINFTTGDKSYTEKLAISDRR